MGESVGYVSIFFVNKAGVCDLSMPALTAECSGKIHGLTVTDCLDYLAAAQAPARPQCDKVYLGPRIGLANIMSFHDTDGTCHLSLTELTSVCQSHYAECMSFLKSSKATPKCDSVFLGPDIGFQNVFEFHDTDGTCKLSMKSLAKVCKQYYQECISFLKSSQQVQKPKCEDVYLGPDVGYVHVFEFNDQDSTCKLSMKELGKVCKQYYQECLNFLKSSEAPPHGKQCAPIFLGPDIGFANVLKYHDSDDSCQLSVQELAKVCEKFFQECLNFLASSETAKQPKCDPVFLGPDIGFANIFKYHDDDGSCQISMTELGQVCQQHYAECLAFLKSDDKGATVPEGFPGAECRFRRYFRLQ